MNTSAATPGTGPTAASFPDIDPGGTTLTSLHFNLRGYSESEIRPVQTMAEDLYTKIGNDTGLSSFLTAGSYTIVIYRDRTEYLEKTRQPTWSRAVASGGSIYLYPGSDLEPVLAHEMTHLIFNAYMGGHAAEHRWLNEGLAMYEETAKWSETDRATFRSSSAEQLRDRKMSFKEMTFFTPATEERRRVDVWYQQVTSVVSFLLAQGSAINFSNFLNALRNGTNADQAISEHYPGKFRDLKELETSWKYTV